MKLTTIGSGTFFVDKVVSASSFLLETNGKKILVDCGPGTLVKLGQAGIKLKDIDYVFLTHFHPDHTSDLFPLFMNFRLNDLFSEEKSTKYPTFFGPKGFNKFMLDLSHVTQLRSVEGWEKIKIKEYEKVVEVGEVKVRPFEVLHETFGIKVAAHALRFEIENKVIVFSGDSVDCAGIRKACKNADLFVCDASIPKDMTTKAHMNTIDIGKISQEGKVKEVMLVHFYPHFNKDQLVSEVKEHFGGKVSKAQDLKIIEI